MQTIECQTKTQLVINKIQGVPQKTRNNFSFDLSRKHFRLDFETKFTQFDRN